MNQVRPGWYSDPFGSATYRWWDGGSWTEHTRNEPGQPGESVSAPGDGKRTTGRRRLLTFSVAAGLLLAGVLLAGGLFDREDEAPPTVASEADGTDFDGIVTQRCGGPPGSTEYYTQARCLLELMSPMHAAATDDRALTTILQDACRHPDMPAHTLATRIAPVEGSTLAYMTLTIRLARTYCGAGDSLDYDGFRGDATSAGSGSDGSHIDGRQGAVSAYIAHLHANDPRFREVSTDLLIEGGDAVCAGLDAGLTMEEILANATDRHMGLVMVDGAIQHLCPDRLPR